jgi:hypothetical protein
VSPETKRKIQRKLDSVGAWVVFGLLLVCCTLLYTEGYIPTWPEYLGMK